MYLGSTRRSMERRLIEAALVETRLQQTALAEQGDVDSMVLLGSMHLDVRPSEQRHL